jgi:hypothetical protein
MLIVKRLCFDIEVVDSKQGPFKCAVVFNEQSGAYSEFNERELDDLVAMLLTADELITYSGKHHDLSIIERDCENGSAAELRNIKHHDLWETYSGGLDNMAEIYIPEMLPSLLRERDERTARAKERPPGETGWASLGHVWDGISDKLATATYDVKRTYAIFKVLTATQK